MTILHDGQVPIVLEPITETNNASCGVYYSLSSRNFSGTCDSGNCSGRCVFFSRNKHMPSHCGSATNAFNFIITKLPHIKTLYPELFI